jgi:cell division protein FtsZ
MTRNGDTSSNIETRASIKVIGCGRAGSNAVDAMIKAGLPGLDFWAFDTDGEGLQQALAVNRLQMGANLRGGANGDSGIGRQAAESSRNEISESLAGADIIFVISGLGGGTGTGAAPIVAQEAKRLGALTIGLVSDLVHFQDAHVTIKTLDRTEQLLAGADCLILLSSHEVSQSLDLLESRDARLGEANKELAELVRCISGPLVGDPIAGADLENVKEILQMSGSAQVGMGQATGDNCPRKAVFNAISSPRLAAPIYNAAGVIITLIAGNGLTLHEFQDGLNLLYESVSEETKVIVTGIIDDSLDKQAHCTLVVTGLEAVVSSCL